MNRRRLPAPEFDRCWATVYQGSYDFAARCPYRRGQDSDLCGRHQAMETEGRTVKRVKAPEVSR